MKKNILFFTKNWLGDILFELPAIEAVRRAYPHARITCLTHKRCVEVVSAVPYIHEVIPYDEDGRHWGPWGHVRLARELRKYGFDQVYLFHRSLTRSLVMLFANIPTRIGYNVKGRGSFLTHAVPDPGQESMHHVDYFLNLVTSQGMKGPTHRTYEFFFSQKDNETAEALLKSQGLEVKKFIVFNPGSNWAPKRWPTLSFAQLGKKLPAIPIVVTGHQADQALFREMQTQAPHVQWISLCGKTSIRVLAAVLSKALFVVTGDSGPIVYVPGKFQASLYDEIANIFCSFFVGGKHVVPDMDFLEAAAEHVFHLIHYSLCGLGTPLDGENAFVAVGADIGTATTGLHRPHGILSPRETRGAILGKVE
jgi:lipopolysaccharide heptosyltransferase II